MLSYDQVETLDFGKTVQKGRAPLTALRLGYMIAPGLGTGDVNFNPCLGCWASPPSVLC